MEHTTNTQGPRALFATAVAVVSFAIAASAASLGGISVSDLFGWTAPVSIPVPTVMSYDDFACSGSLDGQTDAQGNVWSDHGGNWQCLGSGVVRSQARVANGHATADLGISDSVNISTRLSSISTQKNKSGGGLAFLSDGISHLFVVYERDQGVITLGKREVALVSTLASATVADRDSMTIAVEINQPTIRVLVDGTEVITYSLSTTESLLFGPNTRFGLAADNDNQTKFDWFLTEQP